MQRVPDLVDTGIKEYRAWRESERENYSIAYPSLRGNHGATAIDRKIRG